MSSLTLHELSLQLNVSVRVLRHRLRRLLLEGKLVENRDCHREGYVDATHFVWRVDPVAFVRATGYQTASQSGSESAISPHSLDTQANRAPQAVSHQAQAEEPRLPNVDKLSFALEREMIDLLKEQLSKKDGQIADLSDQNKNLNDVNLKLVAQTVQQSDRIQTLLRLTEGKMELADMVANFGSESGGTDNDPGAHAARAGNDLGNQPPPASIGRGGARAA